VVPVIDLSRRGRSLAAAYAAVVHEVTARGTYLLGERTAAFERDLAAHCAAPHAAAVASGASALQLALRALDVGPGDEVIVPAFTAVPTAAAVAAVGAVPVPVDVEPGTANLDAALVDRARTRATKAVIVVDLYGRPAGLPITDLPIVEDAAQAIGAVADHRTPRLVAYSFYPTKNLGGIGDGGAVVTHDAALDQRIRRLRVHGMTEQYVHVEVAQNFRMSELEAAWLSLGLPSLAARNQRRRHIAARYREAAPQLRWQDDHAHHVHHLAVLRTPERERLRAELAARSVATAVHYPLAITQQPAYRHLTRGACPNAEAWAAECVTVPCFPELTDAEVEQVAAALAEVADRCVTA
jgi:dTDP-4-amino-4,6-dideoxygalactose transaminase